MSFFFDYTINDKSYFDETQPTQSVKASNSVLTSSISTSNIDAYRQGVEIKTIKHFSEGIVKISAGEPGHQLRRNSFGMASSYSNEIAFKELDYFDPTTYIIAQDKESTLYFNLLTFPIVVSDIDHIQNFIYDGAIEPLTIRAKSSFFSIDAPFEAHDVRGALMQGNCDITNASDLIVDSYKANEINARPFLDEYADGIEFDSSSNFAYSTSVIAIYDTQKTLLKPFDDVRYVRQSSNNYDSDFLNAMSLMSSSLSDVVEDVHTIYSSNGMLYRDSIAFGDQTFLCQELFHHRKEDLKITF